MMIPEGNALIDVVRERINQIEKGYTAEHDDRHKNGELAMAAACYAMKAAGVEVSGYHWPFEESAYRPEGARHNLVKAVAMLIAEIERIDRDNKPKSL